MGKFVSWAITFLSVIVGWVFFRANDLDSAMAILQGMIGANGVSLPNAILSKLGRGGEWLGSIGIQSHLGGGSDFVFTYLWVGTLLFVALFTPNTQQILSRFEPTLSPYPTNEQYQLEETARLSSLISWAPSAKWAIATGIVAAAGVLALTSVSEFLYFQF